MSQFILAACSESKFEVTRGYGEFQNDQGAAWAESRNGNDVGNLTLADEVELSPGRSEGDCDVKYAVPRSKSQ